MATMAQNITRIENAKTAIKTAIENKGVSIPATAKIDTYSTYVEQIETGGGNIDTELEAYFDSLTNYNYLFYARKLMTPTIWEKYKHCFMGKNIATTNYMTDEVRWIKSIGEVLSSNTTVLNMADLGYNVDWVNGEELDLTTFDFSKFNVSNIAGLKSVNGGTINIKLETLEGNSRKVSLPYLVSNTQTYDNLSIFNLILENNTLIINTNAGFEFYSKMKVNNGNELIIDNRGTNLARLLCGVEIETVRFTDNSVAPTTLDKFAAAMEWGPSSGRYILGVKNIYNINFSNCSDDVIGIFYYTTTSPLLNLVAKTGTKIGPDTKNTALRLNEIWNGDATTYGVYYENFINSLGANTSGYTKTITLNTTLKNSLSATQLALATNKGYTIA